MMQIMPHNILGTLFSFLMPKITVKFNGITHYGGTKCRWGRLKSATFDDYNSKMVKIDT